jgi:hypothetical protein
VAGVAFLLTSQSNVTAGVVADKAQTLFQWAVHQPSVAAAATGSDVQARVDEAGWCLQTIEGHQAPPVNIPGVSCKQATGTEWWQSTLVGSLITGGFGFVAALVGLLSVQARFGFQKSPST